MTARSLIFFVAPMLFLGGCAASSPEAPQTSITLKPLQLEGARPFCVYSPELYIDSQKIVLNQHDQVRACTSETPTPRRDPAAPLYWSNSGSSDAPFWAYKVLTIKFKKSESGPLVSYQVPLGGKLGPKPEFRLAGIFVVVTPDSVKVQRWDIKRKLGQSVSEEIQAVSVVTEVKEAQQ